MMGYSEFLSRYFDTDTSSVGYNPDDTSMRQHKLSIGSVDTKKAYEAYVKKSREVEDSYKKYLKKKQDRFRRNLR